MKSFVMGTAMTYLSVTPQGNAIAKKGFSMAGKLANAYLKTKGINVKEILKETEEN